MADSFSDLWNSSAPSQPAQTLGSLNSKPKPNTLGNALNSTTSNRGRNDLFTMLSSAGSSASNSRPITPSNSPPAPKPGPPSQKPAGGSDAFSNLFSGASSGSANSTNLTMAQRAALAEKERIDKVMKSQQATQSKSSSAWDGLDSLAQSSTTSFAPVSRTASTQSKTTSLFDEWETPAVPSTSNTSSASNAKVIVDDDDWGLSDFAAAPSSFNKSPPAKQLVVAQSKAKSGSLWDMDLNDASEFSAFDLPTDERAPAQRNIQNSRPDSPSKGFDFGDRERGPSLLGDDEEDDVLGVLAKPVSSFANSNHNRTPSPNTQGSKPSSRAPSPPPHLIGQIVEMGFSVQQARIALASTDTGLDVQAALETLLANTNSDRGNSPARNPPQQPRPTRARPSREDSTRSRDTPSPSQRSQTSSTGINTDKLLAQASGFGLSFLKTANAAWKEGKDRVQKAVAETMGDGPSQSDSGANGRPKWMADHPSGQWDNDEDSPNTAKKPVDSFSDGFNDEQSQEERPRGKSRPVRENEATPSARSSPRPPPAEAPLAGLSSKIANLFGAEGDEPKVYTSRFRHSKPSSHAASPSPSRAPPQPSQPSRPSRPPSPPKLKPRANLISASASAISQSNSHKLAGTEKYKLGQYALAEGSYSTAISCLPEGHLLLIPLLNNRAMTRLKTGDFNGVVADCTTVIDIIGPSYVSSYQTEEPVTLPEHGAGVNLGDGLVKAWKRRAEALEGREKWEEARKDWEQVAGAPIQFAGKLRDEGVRGAGRCRKMLDGSSTVTPKPPKPAPPRRRVKTPPPSEAAKALKKANAAAEAEDQLKADLKDKVDAKLIAWKGGKESNIRGLLGSLDLVLWPELGLKSPNMSELISEGQVKVRYMRVIGRLHPDKLNASNSTVEQRMIAQGVFGALNDAWNAFKQ